MNITLHSVRTESCLDFLLLRCAKVSVLKTYTIAKQHVTSGAHRQDNLKMLKKYGKSIVSSDISPIEQNHQRRSQIATIRHELIDCTAFHRLLTCVLHLDPEQYHGVSAATHDGEENSFTTL